MIDGTPKFLLSLQNAQRDTTNEFRCNIQGLWIVFLYLKLAQKFGGVIIESGMISSETISELEQIWYHGKNIYVLTIVSSI